jgi:hypothetical protein
VDVMAINETWLREGEDKRAPALPGYRLLHKPRPASIRSRGGGVGFYIKRGIYARVLEHPDSPTVEQMWLSVKVNGIKIVVGTLYRPPWLETESFLNALSESLTSFSVFDHVIVMGDFNKDLSRINNTNASTLLDFLNCMNLHQYVTEATHFTDHSETLLDLVCSNTKVSKLVIDHIPDLSAHAFISFEVYVKKPKLRPRWLLYRPLKDIDINLFNIHVNSIAWEKLLSDNVNDSVAAFNAQITDLFDLHAPIRRTFIKKASYPWITETIKDMISLRDKAHTKYRLSKLESDKQYYKELKTLVIEAICKEKTAYYQYFINKHIKDHRNLWKNIKRNVIDFKTSNIELPESLCDPELINEHFLKLPGNNRVHSSNLAYFSKNSFSDSVFSLKLVDETTIFNIIKKISTNAQGVDGITLDMILLTLPRTLNVITSIVNSSLQSGNYPEIWKHAIVKPLPKTIHPLKENDLRPVSILPCLSKIIEKAVQIQINEYLKVNNILPAKQSGFRKGMSTVTALLDVVDDILAAQDKGQGSILVLLDYSRAFDTIDTALLIAKLKYYGFDKNALKWFHNYLTNRYQQVEVTPTDGTKKLSTKSLVNKGVPQGSILGPILFILYTSDLPHSVMHTKYHLYADDLQIYTSFKPLETKTFVNKINYDLKNITQWSKDNGLVLNPAKTKFLILGSEKQINQISSSLPEIKLDDVMIEPVNEARNLGVRMDGKLRFEKHVSEVVKQCYYRLRVLYQIRQYLSIDVRIYLCESLILSKLNYADTVTGMCILTRTKKIIQRLQNSCARFCFLIPPRAHITPYLNSRNLMNMETRRQLHFATLLFGVIKDKDPSYLFSKLTFTKRKSRINDRLLCPTHNTAAFRGSFRYSATKCWNNIPPPIRLSCSVGSFKDKYKKHLIKVQKVE